MGDVALLRAAGLDIAATPRGYIIHREEKGLIKTVACRHAGTEMEAELNAMVDLVDNAYAVMIENLTLAFDGNLDEIANAYSAEDRINNQRNNLRDEEIESIESDRKNYQTSVYYMDIVSVLETMGDFMINISQTLYKTKVRIS